MIYKGHCFCAHICFETKGEPLFTQYCHCNKCRDVVKESKNLKDKVGYAYTAAFLTKNFSIVSGHEYLISVVRNSARLYLCKECHTLIYGISEDPNKQGGIGINVNNFQFEGMIPPSFDAVRHVWYQNRLLDFNDNLPKFKDVPKEQFGSGELC